MQDGSDVAEQDDKMFDVATLRRRQIIFDKINKRKK